MLTEITKQIAQYSALNEDECKEFKRLIREALKAERKLPVGIRAQQVVNKTFLKLIGQRDLSTLTTHGVIVNLLHRSAA